MTSTCATLLAQLRTQWDYTTAGVLADAFFDAEDSYNAALWYVLAEPHSDERRLAYAAECEQEVEKFKTCSFCKGTGHKSVMRVTTGCPFCKGVGRIRFREPRDAARAEFVRVQVELAKTPHWIIKDEPEYLRQFRQHSIVNPELNNLRRRERELLDYENRVKWGLNTLPEALRHYAVDLDFTRGFISVITCSAADWLAHGPEIRLCQPVTDVKLTTWHEESSLQFVIGCNYWVWDKFPGIIFELPDPDYNPAFDYMDASPINPTRGG